jgi:hypothetical protein
MLIVGAVPVDGFPLTMGRAVLDGEDIVVDGRRVPCTQGTGAMISAALAVTGHLGIDPPHALLAEDIGNGRGTRDLFEYLVERVDEVCPQVLALHYCLPIMALMRRLCESVGRCPRRVQMIADAGSMYAAKAAGLAPSFDVFTPDASEIAFLADPDATHPAYVARHLFDADVGQTPDLVAAAHKHRNAARLLLVKGSTDYVAEDGGIVATIDEPDVPALEAVGGTGDTITGVVSAFVYAGLELHEAAIIAARANRMAGKFAQATPATSISQIVGQFPAVFEKYLCERSGVCCEAGGQR